MNLHRICSIKILDVHMFIKNIVYITQSIQYNYKYNYTTIYKLDFADLYVDVYNSCY